MAIQFARCAYISRSSGGNACRKAAYNARMTLTCERTGETFSYQTKGEAAYHEILLPQGAHLKFGESSVLWNEAEFCEKRKDSQVAKEIVLALPDDAQMTLEDRIELTRRFATQSFVDKGVAVQIDIHAPDPEEKNWHAHLLVPTRRFSETGETFSSKKATDLDPVVRGSRHTVVEADLWGEIWRDIQNAYFEEKGYGIRVDPIGIIAQEHLGPVRMRHHLNQALERFRELERLNEKLSLHPKSILEALTRHQALFTEHDLDRFLAKHAPQGNPVDLKADVLSHLSVLPLYEKETGERTPFYTTLEVRREEEKLLRFAESIANRTAPVLSPAAIQKGAEGRAFSQEQQTAYEACAGERNLSLIQGRAGVGKSYVLSALCKAHQEEGFQVIGLAPTHKVATALKESGFETFQTCHGFVFSYKHKALPPKTLIVVDEAAMMGSALSVELFNIVKKNGAKLILVGDDRQLSAVDRAGAFGTLAERYGAVELHTVRRQSIDWQKTVSESLSHGKVQDAVQLLHTHNAISWKATREESLADLLTTWTQNIQMGGVHQILAQRNVDVDALNQGAREKLRINGKLGEIEILCSTERGLTAFAVGDRIQLTKTDRKQGLENGRFGEITAIHSKTKTLTLTLDNGEKKDVDPSTYTGLRHGYAATVYKAQGSTLDHVYVLHGRGTNRATNYVALTRQTKTLSLYVSKDETPTERALITQMGRTAERGSSLQFAIERELAHQKATPTFATPLKEGLKMLFTKVTDTFHHNKAFYQVPSSPSSKNEVLIHSSRLSLPYETMSHPAFATSEGIAIQHAFEKGRVLYGEEKANTYWEARSAALLKAYTHDLEKVDETLRTPAFSSLSQVWKTKTIAFAKEDPRKILDVLRTLEERQKTQDFKGDQAFRVDKALKELLSVTQAQDTKTLERLRDQERTHSLTQDRGGLSL